MRNGSPLEKVRLSLKFMAALKSVRLFGEIALEAMGSRLLFGEGEGNREGSCVSLSP